MELIEQWNRLARDRADAVAVVDAGSGRTWRFADLEDAAEASPDENRLWIAARGNGVAFLAATLRAWRDRRPLVPVDIGDPDPGALDELPAWTAHVKRTSGSTGAPRWVLFRARQIVADADAIVTAMGLRPDRPNVAVISMAHSYGFSNLVTPLLLHGIPLVLAESALPGAVARAVSLASEPGGCVLPAVPAMWRAWARAGILGETISLAVSAGAPLPAELERSVLDDLGLKIHNFLGASECGGIAFDRSDEARSDAAEVGAPMPGVSVGTDDDGRLVVRGPAVGEQYWPVADDDLSAGAFRTADLGRVLPDGTLRLEGRLADVINVAGRKVSPERVETVLRSEPGVRECLVFGIPSRDPARVDEVVACLAVDVDIDAEDPAAADALIDRLRRRTARDLATWEVPRHWHLDPTLAPDPRGKLSRTHWRQRFLESRGA